MEKIGKKMGGKKRYFGLFGKRRKLEGKLVKFLVFSSCAHQKCNLPNLERKLERKKSHLERPNCPLALCIVHFLPLLFFFFTPFLLSFYLFLLLSILFLLLFCYSSVFSFIFFPIFFFSHFFWIFVLSLSLF